MANTLTELVPKILAQGLMALRGATVMPRLVNSDYANLAKDKGATIDVPIPSAIAAQDVVAGATPPVTADIAPTTIQIPLDKWKEAPFYLTDNDRLKVNAGILPMQASEAIKSLAACVNGDLMALGCQFYGYYGTAGTTPFSSALLDATRVRGILNKQLAPLTDRRFVLDVDAEANALALPAFATASSSGDTKPIIEGTLGRKVGFDFAMDQQLLLFTGGTLSNGTSKLAKVNKPSGTLIGAKAMNINDTTLTGTVVCGDIFTVAGDTQTYVVTANATAAANAIAGLQFYPAAQVEWAHTAVITFKANHVKNMAFHRDAIAFATRPLVDSADGLGNIIQSTVDPVSGLTLRLEVSREHKRTRWSFDILYGCGVTRRELGAILAG